MSDKNYLSIYAKSFNWAGFFLPRKIYLKCSDLYNFCRTVDNIADNQDKIETKKKNLTDFKNNFNNKNDNDSIIKNMWSLINEHEISTKIVNDLFDGVESDLKNKVEINSKKDLLVYCYRVAGTVGLMMAKILEVKSKNSLKSAIDLGIAMQLTNIGDNILKKKNLENYNNSGKIYVSNIGKIIQTFLSLYDLIRLSLIKSQDHLRYYEHKTINEEINLNERV